MKKLVVPVEVYSRVVGYFRPVSQWNHGKREEFSERIPLKIELTAQSDPKVEQVAKQSHFLLSSS